MQLCLPAVDLIELELYSIQVLLGTIFPFVFLACAVFEQRYMLF